MIRAASLRMCGRVTTLWGHQRAAAAVGVVEVATAQRGLLIKQQLRCHSDVADEDKYLELKQLRDIKSEEFYDLHGQERRYFYYIDLQGRLFLENTRPKNIATSLKSAKFLKFFFSQIRPNDANSPLPAEVEELQFLEYPFRSPCGKEMNFIKCADRPFVFEDFYQDEKTSRWVFAYGGGELKAPFQPEKLKISLATGRLYHDIKTKYSASGSGPTGMDVALIKSQLAVEFGRRITVHDEPIQVAAGTLSSDGRDSDEEVAIIGEFEWQGEAYPIQAIE